MDQVRADHVVVLSPGERLDVAAAVQFENAVDQLIDEGQLAIVVDLGLVEAITSAGVGSFVRNAKAVTEAGGRIALAGMTGEVADVIRKTNLETLFDVYAARDEAIASMAGAASTGAATTGTPIAKAATEAAHVTLPEEVLLLALSDEDGEMIDLPAHALEYAVAGSLLMDLCMHRRIDTDLTTLTVVDPTPIDEPILDPVLAILAGGGEPRSTEQWIESLVKDADDLRRSVVDRLVSRGILKREKNLLRWALGKRRYPVVADTEQREVRQRILSILLDGELPGPRDVVIIALADACAVFDTLLDMEQMEICRDRIREISGMDLIAQSMRQLLVDVQERSREV